LRLFHNTKIEMGALGFCQSLPCIGNMRLGGLLGYEGKIRALGFFGVGDRGDDPRVRLGD
jgi:hypothetical protein